MELFILLLKAYYGPHLYLYCRLYPKGKKENKPYGHLKYL